MSATSNRRLVLFALLCAILAAVFFGWFAARDGGTLSRIFVTGLVGAFCGVVVAGVGSLLLWFVRRLRAGAPAPVALDAGEELLRTLRANHLTRAESRGGKLLLTNRRVVFQPHRFNATTEPLALSLAEIDEVRVAPEQLSFVVRGEVLRFIVTLGGDDELEALGARLASMVLAARPR